MSTNCISKIKDSDNIVFTEIEGSQYSLRLENFEDVLNCYLDFKLEKHFDVIADRIYKGYKKHPQFIKTYFGFITPNKFTLTDKGIESTRKINIGRHEIFEDIILSDKWIFVTSKVYSKYHGIYQYEVMSYSPNTKKTITGLCLADNLGKFNYCISFCMNNLNVVTNENYKKELLTYFNSFLLQNDYLLKNKITLPQMGWNEDCTDFFPYSDKIYFDFTGDQSNYLRNVVSSFNSKGNQKEFIDKFKYLSKKLDAELIFGTCFAAPLLKLTGTRSFAINFYGDSGCFKSLISKFAMACWGNPNKICSAGNHTTNVLVEKLSKFNNLSFYIDEITHESMDIYSMCNESGRHRLNQAGQIKDAITWRTSMFSTSEISMELDSQKMGEINRYLCLNVNCIPEDIIDKDDYARELYLFIEKNYGLLGKQFIKEIINNKERILNDFEYILKTCNSSHYQKQHILIISNIYNAVYIYRRLFFNDDNIQYTIDHARLMLNKLTKKEHLNPALNMRNVMLEFYEINKNAFKSGDSDIPMKTNYCYGKVKDNQVFFILGPLKDHLEKKGFNWNEKRVLIEQNLIEYKNAKIDKTNAKRIIITLNDKDDEEEKEYDNIERSGIRNENK